MNNSQNLDANYPEAIKKGNFKEDFGIDVDCYVINDKSKTAVVTKGGIAAAIGYQGKGGNNLTRLISSKSMNGFIDEELQKKLDNPIYFSIGSYQAESIASLAHGYDVTIMIDLCKAIIAASDANSLLPRQENIAKQARVILHASAKAGIKGLVYALSGYDATREEIVESFKFYVRQEARDYEREFPEELYNEWYRLYKITKPERNRPWKFMHLTRNQVYYPLAKSNGVILELTQQNRGEETQKRLHQFLDEVGVKALRQHLGQLLAIAKLADNEAEYESNFRKLFSEQNELF